MQFLTVTSLLGFVAGLAIAAPLSPQAVGKVALPREAQSFGKAEHRHVTKFTDYDSIDLTYIDKRDAEAEAVPQGFGMLRLLEGSIQSLLTCQC